MAHLSRFGLALVIAVISPALAGAQARSASSVVPTDVAKLLQRIKAADSDRLAVSEEDGRFLRVMVASTGATRALEIGGASGYSAIWIGLGLRQTGGRLTTIEYDPTRAKAAAEHIREAGLSDIVTVVAGRCVQGDPAARRRLRFRIPRRVEARLQALLRSRLPRLRPRALFLAHNVVNKKDEMTDFLDAVQRNPSVISSIVSPSGEGMSVTVKLR